MQRLLRNAQIVQNAYVVTDLHRACQRVHELYGIGPFLVLERLSFPDALYRGVPAPLELSAALVQCGDLQLEFLQQHSPGPSALSEALEPGAEGFHHVAVLCDDYPSVAESLQSADYDIVSEFQLAPGAVARFVDTRRTLGHLLELIPDAEMTRSLFAAVRNASEQWDGAGELLRPLELQT
jgi:hypothetical protein